jgi:predicted component of type VI protein secretion system
MREAFLPLDRPSGLARACDLWLAGRREEAIDAYTALVRAPDAELVLVGLEPDDVRGRLSAAVDDVVAIGGFLRGPAVSELHKAAVLRAETDAERASLAELKGRWSAATRAHDERLMKAIDPRFVVPGGTVKGDAR